MVVSRKCSFDSPMLWHADRSALQTLHKVSGRARDQNYYQGGGSHAWASHYERRIASDRSCLNEWHAMDSLESRRPPSPGSLRTRPAQRVQAERVIRSALKEIMMSVDLDEVTSKHIRARLEHHLDMDLAEYKSFIDQEMLTVLGQMDAPTEIFDHVYLGSEWNASNYEELQRNGVGHILNVTREIDNFFPGSFNYLNIRVCDDEKTDLLKYWDDTFKYITKAKSQGSKVLVHCKMGVSRSASVVIAYAMKACDWNFSRAMQHVKEKRTCIKPNQSFLTQLETYQGILDAMKNKERLQRSRAGDDDGQQQQRSLFSSSGQDLKQVGERPKSWSPDNKSATEMEDTTGGGKTSPVFLSLEDLSQQKKTKATSSAATVKVKEKKASDTSGRHVLLPCDNGESYSVSPNQIVHLDGQHHDSPAGTVKERVNEFESNADRKKLVLNLSAQFETTTTTTTEEEEEEETSCGDAVIQSDDFTATCDRLDNETLLRSTVETAEPTNDTWDPGERANDQQLQEQHQIISSTSTTSDNCDQQNADCVASGGEDARTCCVWTCSTVVKTVAETVMAVSDESTKVPVCVAAADPTATATTTKQVTLRGDPFSSSVDRVFDREEKKQHHQQQQQRSTQEPPPTAEEVAVASRECPSRQHSWSSYDSAVVLGDTPQSDHLSRHSSWGSGDNTTRTLPSRNSSWGSYDMRARSSIHYVNENGERVLHPSSAEMTIERSSSSGVFPYDRDEIPWHPGTVRRTKQKLEESGAPKKSDDEDSVSLRSSSHSLVKSPSSETLLFDYPTQEAAAHAQTVNSVLLESSRRRAGSAEVQAENSSAISDTIDIPKETPAQQQQQRDVVIGRSKLSRLSASAPECSSMVLIGRECSLSRSESNVSNMEKSHKDSNSTAVIGFSSVRQHRNILENLHRETAAARKTSEESDERSNSTHGIVKNLKKEFEARTNTDHSSDTSQDLSSKATTKISSLPTSPVSLQQHKEKAEEQRQQQQDEDDMSVKNLLGRFEGGKPVEAPVVHFRTKGAPKPFRSKGSRHSCIEMPMGKGAPVVAPARGIAQTPLITSLNKNCLQTTAGENNRSREEEREYSRRPPAGPGMRNPSPGRVVAATVIAKAAKKQQQQYGRSHPLALLNINPRHNNPVYNTM